MTNGTNVYPFSIKKKKAEIKNYTNEVESIFNNQNVCIGFRVRRDVLYGFAMEVENDWYTTKSLINPLWEGGFKNRKEAKNHLEIKSQEAINLRLFWIPLMINSLLPKKRNLLKGLIFWWHNSNLKKYLF